MAFIIPAVSTCGGCERVLSLLANHFAAAGHEVTVFTYEDAGPPFFPLAEGIRVAQVGTRWAPVRGLLALHHTRRALARWRADVVLSFMRSNFALLSCLGLGIPVVVTEHMDPARTWMAPGRRQLRRLTYRWAAAVVCVNEGIRAQFGWLPPGRVRVIHNPAVAPARRNENVLDPSFRWILAAGRVVREKGFDLLLEAFGRLAPRHPKWRLCIVGGPPDPAMVAVVNRYGHGDACLFPGATDSLGDYMAQAELFVLSSRVDAFPMVLVEALSSGMAVIATRCSSGPGEVIQDAVNGVLVPPESVDDLAAAMDRLMADGPERARLGGNALASARSLSAEAIMREWDTLLEELAHSSRRARMASTS